MENALALSLAVGKNVGLNIFILFILMGVGFSFARKKIVTDIGIKQMTELLLKAVVPCVIINAYQREFNGFMVKNLIIALVFSILIHFIAMLVLPLVFRNNSGNNRINIFSVMYSNAGFIALPLVSGVFGSEGVFYAVAYLTVFNILYWTHGVYVYTGDIKQLSFKKAFLTPGVLGTLIGLLLFLFRIELPFFAQKTVSYLAALNTPLPMFIMGAYLVNLDIKRVIKNSEMWFVCCLRLVAFPLAAILLANLMGMEDAIKLPLVMSSACPVAVVATLFATRYGLDSAYASEVVSMTNLLSIITLPVIMIVAVLI